MKIKIKATVRDDLVHTVRRFIENKVEKLKDDIKKYIKLDERLDFIEDLKCICKDGITCDRCRLVKSYNQELNEMER